MQRFFDIFADFVYRGVGAILRFVGAIGSWVTRQIGHIVPLPWQDWPMWRLLLLGFLLFGVGWYLYYALWELWEGLKKLGAALRAMMGVLIKTLPHILIAGLLALAGVWLLSLDLSTFPKPWFLQTGSRHADPWYSDCSGRDCRR
jgi:hypothetical protein